MFKKAGMLFFYTLTPLHPGTGSTVAAVDLPVQRERHTNFPMIQASGVKGALRDLAGALKEADKLGDKGKAKEKIEIVFGPETDRASEHGGALALTDARILLFPVRSVKGVFAWITCPGVIARLMRDLEVFKGTNRSSIDLQTLQTAAEISLNSLQACASPNSDVVLHNNQIILEDFCFKVVDDSKRKQVEDLAQWLVNNALPDGLNYWKDKLKKDLVLINDHDFAEFVEMSTEVITRIKLGEKGTVDTGPWDEEHLPTETLLYSLSLATDPKLTKDELQNAPIKNADEVLKFVQADLVSKAHVMQVGGDETVGKGLVCVRFFDGREEKNNGKQQETGQKGTGG